MIVLPDSWTVGVAVNKGNTKCSEDLQCSV